MYKNLIKRVIDIAISFIILLFISPVIIVIILALVVSNNGKVFFVQKRPGYKEKIFSLYKLKTMNDGTDDSGNLLPDSERLTAMGEIIRKLSLDEIPQLVNVIKGDMSLIGPRPWLVEYLSLYNESQRKRHNVKPGITGWAQVNGRNLVDWDQRFEYDLFYVDHLSFMLDAKIIVLTIWNIVISKGVSAVGEATMSKFKGNG